MNNLDSDKIIDMDINLCKKEFFLKSKDGRLCGVGRVPARFRK